MHRSYNENDAIANGIREAARKAELKRFSALTWQQMCVEGMEDSVLTLQRRLEKARAIADTIPVIEAQLEHETLKLAQFRNEHGVHHSKYSLESCPKVEL